MTKEITFSKRLAPEDILPGMFVAIGAMVHEIVPIWLIDSAVSKAPDIIRVPCIGCADGDPKLVLAVCLPFVLTEDCRGRTETLDTRQHQLVQVDELYGLELFTRPQPKCNCYE